MKKLRVLDLFSGIGCFSLGLERAGMETVAFCENDEGCRKVLRKHWPKVPIHKDVKRINAKDLKAKKIWPIDVLCGGFPCQDISVAGKQKGLEGERSGLWTEFKRLIQEIRPKYALIENVPNLANKGLGRIVKDLHEIGYGLEWHIVGARNLGAPHLRERIWIIAYPESEGFKGRNEQRGGLEASRKETVAKSGLFNVGGEATNPDRSDIRQQPRGRGRPEGESEAVARTDGHPPNTDHLRLWQSFASEETASGWWAKVRTRLNYWAKTQPPVCGISHGIATGIYRHRERRRKERIRQLGNSLVPQIPELIGRAILKWEEKK